MRVRMQDFIGILVLLMVTSWWLLLARVVQAETLVGEQQFWITRPYQEVEKCAGGEITVCVAVWVYLPFVLTARSCICWRWRAFIRWLTFARMLIHGLAIGRRIVILLPLVVIAAVTE